MAKVKGKGRRITPQETAKMRAIYASGMPVFRIAMEMGLSDHAAYVRCGGSISREARAAAVRKWKAGRGQEADSAGPSAPALPAPAEAAEQDQEQAFLERQRQKMRAAGYAPAFSRQPQNGLRAQGQAAPAPVDGPELRSLVRRLVVEVLLEALAVPAGKQ